MRGAEQTDELDSMKRVKALVLQNQDMKGPRGDGEHRPPTPREPSVRVWGGMGMGQGGRPVGHWTVSPQGS